ncbi:MAG: hypothetical protein HY685_02465, partial [Chloroflexi bacterium]|nr:hypothetical protein [Chloroflexota bacterium]
MSAQQDPIVVVGGFGSSPRTYRGVAAYLSRGGYREVAVAPIARYEWFAGSRGGWRPLAARLAETVDRALRETGAQRVRIVAHSAGGLVSRLYLGDRPYRGLPPFHGHERVRLLLTLGTPHSGRVAPEIEELYPGAYCAPEVRYVSVASTAYRGNPWGWPWQMFTAHSYRRFRGDPRGVGDGVVPLSVAVLEGSEAVVLEEGWHGPIPLLPPVV